VLRLIDEIEDPERGTFMDPTSPTYDEKNAARVNAARMGMSPAIARENAKHAPVLAATAVGGLGGGLWAQGAAASGTDLALNGDPTQAVVTGGATMAPAMAWRYLRMLGNKATPIPGTPEIPPTPAQKVEEPMMSAGGGPAVRTAVVRRPGQYPVTPVAAHTVTEEVPTGLVGADGQPITKTVTRDVPAVEGRPGRRAGRMEVPVYAGDTDTLATKKTTVTRPGTPGRPATPPTPADPMKIFPIGIGRSGDPKFLQYKPTLEGGRWLGAERGPGAWPAGVTNLVPEAAAPMTGEAAARALWEYLSQPRHNSGGGR